MKHPWKVSRRKVPGADVPATSFVRVSAKRYMERDQGIPIADGRRRYPRVGN